MPMLYDDFGLILRALQFASERHKNQRRKGQDASPYINHPIALAHCMHIEGGINSPVALAAAILHDTVEDTDTTSEELTRRFGAEVASIVGEVTDDKNLPKGQRKRLQVEHAHGISLEAKWVKLADKISNLRDVLASPPAHWPGWRKRQYFDWCKEVVDQMRGANERLEAIFDSLYERKREIID